MEGKHPNGQQFGKTQPASAMHGAESWADPRMVRSKISVQFHNEKFYFAQKIFFSFGKLRRNICYLPAGRSG